MTRKLVLYWCIEFWIHKGKLKNKISILFFIENGIHFKLLERSWYQLFFDLVTLALDDFPHLHDERLNPVVIPAFVRVAGEVVRRFEKEGRWFYGRNGKWKMSHPTTPKPKSSNSKSAGKVMYGNGVLGSKGSTVGGFHAPGNTTINAERYYQTLQKLRQAIENKRPGMLTKCGSHIRRRNRSRGLGGKWSGGGTPYSPDAPSDFYMFPSLKKHLVRGERRGARGGKRLYSQRGQYDNGIQNFIKRMRKVIEHQGDIKK